MTRTDALTGPAVQTSPAAAWILEAASGVGAYLYLLATGTVGLFFVTPAAVVPRIEEGFAAVLAQLERLGGSSGGARPKILVALHPERDHAIAGDADIPAGYEAWIVKFRAKDDPEGIGPIEAAYNDMAKAAGLKTSDHRLLPSKGGGPGYFATKRFDRVPGGGRLHFGSLSGLAEARWDVPAVDYDALLRATRAITRHEPDVVDAFRRMAFNVAVRDRDDHAKQHGYLMDRSGRWRLASAYDLTFSSGPGGEHSLSVAGEGRSPSWPHMAALGASHGIRQADVRRIVEETLAAAGRFRSFAKDRGALRSTTGAVGAAIDDRIKAIAGDMGTAALTPRKSGRGGKGTGR